MRDNRLKNRLIGAAGATVTAVATYFFRDWLFCPVQVPFFVLPLLVIVSAVGALWLYNYVMDLKRYKNTRHYRTVIKPGMYFGVEGGQSKLTAIEWSWFNPHILIAQNQQGVQLRVHASIIVLYV
jgi:hypothetical protein